MEKLYYKNTWALLLLFIPLEVYAVYNYVEHKSLLERSSPEQHVITKLYCGAYRSASSVEIKVAEKIYRVSVSNNFCLNSLVGDTISVHYNTEKDSFYFPGTNGTFVGLPGVIIGAIMLTLILIPWKLFARR